MSTNNRMFLLLTNNVRVLVIFKRIIVTICKKDKQLEYIFLEIYHIHNGLYAHSECFIFILFIRRAITKKKYTLFKFIPFITVIAVMIECLFISFLFLLSLF